MLKVNQLAGFSRHRYPPVRIRFVNSYTFTYGGTINGVGTIAIADLQFAPSPFRQLLVCLITEVPLISTMSVNGVEVSPLSTSGLFPIVIGFASQHTSNITIGAVAQATSTEVGRIIVYEVEYAAPIESSLFHTDGEQVTVTTNYELPVPDRGAGVVFAYNGTDTATFTFNGGVTEDLDIDGGDMRAGSASISTAGRISSTVVGSAGVVIPISVGLRPLDDKGVGGGFNCFAGRLSADPITVDSFPNNVSRGSCKIVIGIQIETDQTIVGVTIGGQALTRIAQVTNTAASPDLHAEFWSIDIVNGSPTGNVIIDFSAAPGPSVTMSKWYFYGINSLGTPQSVTGNGTGNAVSVDVKKGGVILALSMHPAAETTAWTGVAQVVDFATVDYASSIAQRLMCDEETGRVVQAVGSASGQYATLAMAFNP